MEFKVGQVWENKSGTMVTIIGLDNKSAALKMATGEIGCHSISFLEWHIQQLELELVSDPQLSDLEIVQKALDKSGASMSVKNGVFILEFLESCGGYTLSVIDSLEFDSSSGLLAWAKQTVGVE